MFYEFLVTECNQNIVFSEINSLKNVSKQRKNIRDSLRKFQGLLILERPISQLNKVNFDRFGTSSAYIL